MSIAQALTRVLTPLARSWRIAPLGSTHLVVVVLCGFVGGAVNPWRAAWVAAPSTPTFRGFHVPDGEYRGQAVKWARDYAKVEYLDLAWRPLRIRVEVAGDDRLPPEGLPVTIKVNDRLLARTTVHPGWHRIEVVTDQPAAVTVLQFTRDGVPATPGAFGVGDIHIVRALSAPRVLWHGLLGMLAGIVAGLFIVVRPADRTGASPEACGSEDTAARTSSPAVMPLEGHITRTAVAVFLILVAYLGAWAVLKPVMQAPDEPQHLLRANSVLRSRWHDTPSVLTLDPRFANPIAWMPPDGLGDLFFHGERHLSRAAVDALQRWPWVPTPTHWPTPLTTYPPGYYGLVFALSEPVSAALTLTPYQSVFVYRAWTVVLAAALWTLVYLALLTLRETRDHAAAILALVVLNPMLAFVTSSVTPDAVNNPLAALSLILAYRTGITGRHPWATTLALVACAFTKPSALLLFVGLAAGTVTLWRSHSLPIANAVPVTLAVGRAAAIAVVGFYAWSPPRFVAGPPVQLTLHGYVEMFAARLPRFWVDFWGRPGWLDYQLPAAWYQILFVLVVVNAVLAFRRRAPFVTFTAVILVTYLILAAAGEFYWLSRAGYNYQGRHMFPAILAIGALALHDSCLSRRALVGFLGVMSVAMAVETVQRYFAGDWGLLWASLP